MHNRLILLILILSLTVISTSAQISGMYTSINPGDNFFKYSNGQWLTENPVPADLMMYTSVNEVTDKVDKQLISLIQEAADNTSAPEKSAEWTIGTFYKTAMDTKKANQAGIKPVIPYLTEIGNITDRDDLKIVLNDLQNAGFTPFYSIYAADDPGDKGMLIATICQAGLSFPSKEYYSSTIPEIVTLRDDYKNYVTELFELYGIENTDATEYADDVIKIETFLAEASSDSTGYGKSSQSYYKINNTTLQVEFPGIDWNDLFTLSGRPDLSEVNIQQPGYLQKVSQITEEEDIDTIKHFLTFRVLQFASSIADDRFKEAYQNFYEKKLYGQDTTTPWWRSVLSMCNDVLGNAIGQAYVTKYFHKEDKEEATQMMNDLSDTLRIRLSNNTWMGNSTKETAKDKLDKIRIQVGYPERWGNYSGMNLTNASYLENVIDLSGYYFRQSMQISGMESDPDTWYLSPQEVNAYYDSLRNSIVLPAGILQEPFYNTSADPALNYGAIGSMMAHEFIHGFDATGRGYDANGSLNNWWTQDDLENYARTAFPLYLQISRTEGIDGLYLNGTRNIGESVADLGGLTVAYNAYINRYPDEADKIGDDGFTGKQRFFIGYAQSWRGNIRDEALRSMILVEGHPWNEYRVNIIPFNMDEFYSAFPEIGPDNSLYISPENRSHLW